MLSKRQIIIPNVASSEKYSAPKGGVPLSLWRTERVSRYFGPDSGVRLLRDGFAVRPESTPKIISFDRKDSQVNSGPEQEETYPSAKSYFTSDSILTSSTLRSQVLMIIKWLWLRIRDRHYLGRVVCSSSGAIEESTCT
ncbi:hypothetical protein TNCT_117281 [Trichonephila clavata]|uniref:Uncharacterized protein n=1 Tax=Trichonephila clavata TaxID=2740835 RepID=A0A8X6LTM3_TRICU|nr:hypothetical protein TNCT_117281 [Trichonephila clavata]